MKNLKRVLMVTVMIIGSTLLFNNKANAWPLPQQYIMFVFDTPTSGYLWCSGDGTCAEVIGNQIYFDIYVGNWHGYTPVEDEEVSYYIDNVASQ